MAYVVSDNATGPFIVSTGQTGDVDSDSTNCSIYNAQIYVNLYDLDPN